MSEWTEADQAELAVLLNALTTDYAAHRERCGICLTKAPCPHLQEAISVVLEWRRARILASRAQHLRAQLDAAA